MSSITNKAPYKRLLVAERFQRCLKIVVIYMYIAPEQGQTTLCEHIFVTNINFLSIFPHLMTTLDGISTTLSQSEETSAIRYFLSGVLW